MLSTNPNGPDTIQRISRETVEYLRAKCGSVADTGQVERAVTNALKSTGVLAKMNEHDQAIGSIKDILSRVGGLFRKAK